MYYTCVYAEWGRVLSVHYLDAISSVGACTVKIFSVLYLEEIGEPSSRTLNGKYVSVKCHSCSDLGVYISVYMYTGCLTKVLVRAHPNLLAMKSKSSCHT